MAILDSFLNSKYEINFESIQVEDPKRKGLVIVGMTDIMRQAASLARKVNDLTKSDKMKMWKLLLDVTCYVVKNAAGCMNDDFHLSKLNAEALLLQGEALLYFSFMSDETNADALAGDTNPATDDAKLWQKVVADPLLQSVTLSMKLKDELLFDATASMLWSYNRSIKDALKFNAMFWMEVFQKLYEGILEIGLEDSELMVHIVIGYAEALKKLHEQSFAQVAQEEKEKAPPQGKGAKGQTPAKAAPVKAQMQPSGNSNYIKLAEEVCNKGLASKCGAHEAKMVLFNIRSTLKPGASYGAESDIVMKLFSGLELLEAQKKPSKDELDDVIQDLVKTEPKLSINLKFEFWKRVIQYASKTGQHHLSFECIRRLFQLLPTNYSVQYLIDKEIDLNIVCACELLYGQIVLNLCEAKIPFGSMVEMKLVAMQRIANAVEIACNASAALVPEITNGLDLLNAVIVKFQEPKSAIVEPLERVLKSLTVSIMQKGTVANSLSLFQNTMMSLYELLLEAYTSQSNSVAGIRMIENMFRIMPKSVHRHLWEQKVQILSQSRKGVAITLLKETDPETQSIM
jgi:hypothetical protein